MAKKKNELSEKIEVMLKEEKACNVFEFIKTSHQTDKIENSTLALLFLAYIDTIGWENEAEGISPIILMEDLCQINTYFRPTNGNQWARSHEGVIGSKYIIDRKKKDGQAYSIQLVGFNSSLRGLRSIRKDIHDTVKRQRCVVLDTSTQIEVDHKNGRYDDEKVSKTESQTIDDFQPLHKSVNDAKRQHCKRCVENHKRYDAKRLGYKEGWVYGDEDDLICKGCYWYDPKEFNKTISKDFVKEDKDDENIESQE